MRIRLTALLLFILISFAALPAQNSGYHLIKRLPLGGEGFWDYLTFDGADHRIFISHGTHVMVVDAQTYKVSGDIPDTPGVHGIALAPELGRGFISNGKEGTASIFDLKSLKLIQKVHTGENPDAIAYDPASKRVFTFNGRSHDVTAIDAQTGAVAGTIPLNAKPEFAVADGTGQIFVNLEDKSSLAVLDSKALKVKSQSSLSPCEEPTGLALDREHHRLFSGCSNKLMAVVDATNGKVVTTLPIGDGVDATAFDPGTDLAFSSNGEGTLTVIHEDSPEKFHVVETVKTEPGARTMALDEQSHNIYLVTAKFGPPPAATAEQPHPRRSVLPDSFVLLLVGK
jgi:YVTN family beta-propeller protein